MSSHRVLMFAIGLFCLVGVASADEADCNDTANDAAKAAAKAAFEKFKKSDPKTLSVNELAWAKRCADAPTKAQIQRILFDRIRWKTNEHPDVAHMPAPAEGRIPRVPSDFDIFLYDRRWTS